MKTETILAFMIATAPIAAHAQGAPIPPADGELISPVASTGGYESHLLYPTSMFLEYGSTVRSADPNPIGLVDTDTNTVRIGMDFVGPLGVNMGVAIDVARSHDDGTLTLLAPSVVTDSDIVSFSGYLSGYVSPRLRAGLGFSYTRSDDTTVYNGAAVVTGDASSWSVSPYFTYMAYESDRFSLAVGGQLTYQESDTDYVGNIPPTASRSMTVARVPVSFAYAATDNLTLSGAMTFNSILDQETFTTFPAEDEFSVNLSANVSYRLAGGQEIYAGASSDLFDDAYDTTSFVVGVRFPF